MPILRIENAVIMTMAAGPAAPEEGWVFEAVDGEITYVGPAESFEPSGEPDELLDAAGMLLLPGFVNTHTHAAMTLFRGAADDMPLKPWLEEKIWPVELRLTPDDVYWGTMLGIAEMLRAGVTCFNDMYHVPEMGTRAAEDSGIRMCPSGVLLGILPNAGDMLAQAAEFCGEYPRRPDSRIAPMIAPHAPYTCPREMLETVIATAAECGVPLHIHLAETQANVEWSLETYGKRPVQAMRDIGLFDVPVLAAH
ncbi:MAG: amidohydrolase family protein, partial [Armatimonadetes bacterium]|nr:amidohydrolase family protein [Armatimonadota bacterium]